MKRITAWLVLVTFLHQQILWAGEPYLDLGQTQSPQKPIENALAHGSKEASDPIESVLSDTNFLLEQEASPLTRIDPKSTGSQGDSASEYVFSASMDSVIARRPEGEIPRSSLRAPRSGAKPASPAGGQSTGSGQAPQSQGFEIASPPQRLADPPFRWAETSLGTPPRNDDFVVRVRNHVRNSIHFSDGHSRAP